MGKSTIFMVIFHSKLYVYQRVAINSPVSLPELWGQAETAQSPSSTPPVPYGDHGGLSHPIEDQKKKRKTLNKTGNHTVFVDYMGIYRGIPQFIQVFRRYLLTSFNSYHDQQLCTKSNLKATFTVPAGWREKDWRMGQSMSKRVGLDNGRKMCF